MVGVNYKNVELHKFNSSPDIKRIIIKKCKFNFKHLSEESVSDHQQNLGKMFELGIRF